MAVQVPRINRFEPQAQPSQGRSEVNVPNLSGAVQPQVSAAMSLGENVGEFFLKQEEAAIDTAAKAAANEYSIYLNQELNKARQFQGDPTSVYSQFDEGSVKKYEEIVNKNPNLSSRGKAAVQGALSEIATSYKIKRDTAYSGQYYDYDKKVTEDAVGLTAQDLMSQASYINPEDENSFRGVDATIRRIGNLYKTHGEKFGAVERDENGNQIATPGIQLQIAKATSDGLVASIQNLNDSGRPDLADAMFAKYYKYIDVKKQDDLTKKIREEKQKIDVENTVVQTIGMTPEKAELFISKTFKDNPDAKNKAFEALDTRTRQLDNIATRTSNKHYSIAANHVFDRMNSSDPYVTVYEMENDPVVAKSLNMITKPEQRAALQKIVQKPSKSNYEVFSRNLENQRLNRYAGMPAETFLQETSGLNSEDFNRMYRAWTDSNKESEGQVRSRINDGVNRLRESLIASGVVPMKEGKPSKKGLALLDRYESEFRDSSTYITKDTPYPEIEKTVKAYVNKAVTKKDAQDKKGWWSRFFGGSKPEDEVDEKVLTQPLPTRRGSIYYPNSPMDPNATRTVPKSKPAPVTQPSTGRTTVPGTPKKLTKTETAEAYNRYKKKNGQPPPNQEALLKFISEGN